MRMACWKLIIPEGMFFLAPDLCIGVTVSSNPFLDDLMPGQSPHTLLSLLLFFVACSRPTAPDAGSVCDQMKEILDVSKMKRCWDESGLWI